MRPWHHRVTSAEAGERLDRFLQRALGDLTRSQVKKLVDRGLARVDGLAAKAGHALRDGEFLEVLRPEPPPIAVEPEDIPLPVLYEDGAVLVVDKPGGMAVHPGAGRSRGTLVNALLGRGTPLSELGAPFRPGIVHRLDKGTSGLLVVAKTDAAHLRLARDLAAREISRRYWAMLWGGLDEDRGRITGALARSRADRRRMRVVSRGGREATTRYVVVGRWGPVSVARVELETGRTHQIRAHFKHLGHPVFGDPEYGGRARRASSLTPATRERVRQALAALPRQALHAEALAFRHPETGKPLAFVSSLAQDIRTAAEALGIPPEALFTEVKETV